MSTNHSTLIVTDSDDLDNLHSLVLPNHHLTLQGHTIKKIIGLCYLFVTSIYPPPSYFVQTNDLVLICFLVWWFDGDGTLLMGPSSSVVVGLLEVEPKLHI